MGRSADALTAARIVLALPMAAAAYKASWSVTALLLSLAWWSDFLDGRLARRAGGTSRMGKWDLAADTSVGAGLLAGLVLGGHMPLLWGAAGLVLGLGFIMLHNPAFSMLLQAMAYGPALYFAARTDLTAFVVAVTSIAAIAVLASGRLFGYVLPAFFGGLLGRRNHSG